MVRIIKKNPLHYMVDTWLKPHNINNKDGFVKKFTNREDAEEICDINNLDDYGVYTNRFIIKTK